MSIQIGQFELFQEEEGKVWITLPDGEGGEFDALALEKVIEQFYNENF